MLGPDQCAIIGLPWGYREQSQKWGTPVDILTVPCSNTINSAKERQEARLEQGFFGGGRSIRENVWHEHTWLKGTCWVDDVRVRKDSPSSKGKMSALELQKDQSSQQMP